MESLGERKRKALVLEKNQYAKRYFATNSNDDTCKYSKISTYKNKPIFNNFNKIIRKKTKEDIKQNCSDEFVMNSHSQKTQTTWWDCKRRKGKVY